MWWLRRWHLGMSPNNPPPHGPTTWHTCERILADISRRDLGGDAARSDALGVDVQGHGASKSPPPPFRPRVSVKTPSAVFVLHAASRRRPNVRPRTPRSKTGKVGNSMLHSIFFFPSPTMSYAQSATLIRPRCRHALLQKHAASPHLGQRVACEGSGCRLAES